MAASSTTAKGAIDERWASAARANSNESPGRKGSTTRPVWQKITTLTNASPPISF